MLTIRPEERSDQEAIHHVHCAAFGRPDEARLVDALRHHKALTIALVAVQDGGIVGHIAFSPVHIIAKTTIDALGLGPMAVLPAYQRQGIGSRLVEAGLTSCSHTPYGVVVVLGHPQFYPRFGFTPGAPHGIIWEHRAPDDAFMVKELQPGVFTSTHGVVQYHPAFAAL